MLGSATTGVPVFFPSSKNGVSIVCKSIVIYRRLSVHNLHQANAASIHIMAQFRSHTMTGYSAPWRKEREPDEEDDSEPPVTIVKTMEGEKIDLKWNKNNK